GFFVLKHIPSTVRVLRVENLLISTVDENLIKQFVPSLKVLVVEKSYDVQSLSIPSSSRLESVLIRNTLISKMYFEKNDELKALLIVNSHLSEIPPSLKNLTSLSILTIRGSNISVVDLSLVSRMKMLTDLVIDLDRIVIRSLRGIIVDKSSAVKSLFVSKNSTIKIIKIIESQLNKLHFERNYALQQVLIAKCNLKEIPASVHNLINLESFTVGEAFIMTVDLNYFIGLACLNTLQVEMNSVNSVIGLLLQTNSTDLTTLKLWYNQLTTFHFDLVKPFQKLHTLDIAHNVIRSVVGNLTNQSLRYFAIQHNLVSKLDFCSWNEIASLEWLSIGHNRL
uniref:LRR-7030 n=1 Tax=Anopheles quadriannulatus TaxID=34691 RepID=A0A182X105_ANOQN